MDDNAVWQSIVICGHVVLDSIIQQLGRRILRQMYFSIFFRLVSHSTAQNRAFPFVIENLGEARMHVSTLFTPRE
jgi:hypothetical protein